MMTKKILSMIFMLAVVFYFSPAFAQEHGGRPLTAELSGANVVPGPGDSDGEGTATVTLNPGQGEINYEISVSNVENITGIHIHQGDASTGGPVVVAFTSSGELSGTVEDVDKDLIKDIIQNPSEYYLQLHNAEFPAGAVRGQLSK